MSDTAHAPAAPVEVETVSPGPPRRRVLVSAFATSPYAGSEPGGGWNVVLRLAKHHDVTVLCSPGLQNEVVEAFDRYVRESGPIPGLTMQWVKPPPLSWLLQREGVWQRAFYYHGYRSWEKAAYRLALQLHAERPFDLIHRLNMTGFREPGFLWKMDLPYLWGPIAGAVMMPRAFFGLLSLRDRVFYFIRNTLNARQMRTKRRCREAAARSAKLWVVDELNRAMVRDHFGRESSLLLDSGCQPIDDGFVRGVRRHASAQGVVERSARGTQVPADPAARPGGAAWPWTGGGPDRVGRRPRDRALEASGFVAEARRPCDLDPGVCRSPRRSRV